MMLAKELLIYLNTLTLAGYRYGELEWIGTSYEWNVVSRLLNELDK
jgi:hypothetical protein